MMSKEKKYTILYTIGEDAGTITIYLTKADCHWLRNLSSESLNKWITGMNIAITDIMKDSGRLIDRDGA